MDGPIAWWKRRKRLKEEAAQKAQKRALETRYKPFSAQFLPRETTNYAEPVPSRGQDFGQTLVQQYLVHQLLDHGPRLADRDHSCESDGKKTDQETSGGHSRAHQNDDLAREEDLNGYDSGLNTPAISPCSPYDPDRFSPVADTGYDSGSSYSSDSSSSFDSSSSSSGGGSSD